MSKFNIHKFPKTRIAIIDVCEIGRRKHHVTAFLEVDVTVCREKIKKYKKNNGRISFMAWLIKVISHTICDKKTIAAYLNGKQKTIVFDDINISVLIEKEPDGGKVPIPVVIEKSNTLRIEAITKELIDSKKKILTKNDSVIHRKATGFEKFYYLLPGFIRRFIWRYLLKHPKMAFSKMGNVSITSLGMFGKINGWFIPTSIHPICFGIGSIIRKPVVVGNKIEIRDIINMTVLIDHDVIDGASMARFIRILSKNIEKGMLL